MVNPRADGRTATADFNLRDELEPCRQKCVESKGLRQLIYFQGEFLRPRLNEPEDSKRPILTNPRAQNPSLLLLHSGIYLTIADPLPTGNTLLTNYDDG
jgi:hypothetical protein